MPEVKQWRLNRTFRGLPDPQDFVMETATLPDHLQPGEFLCEAMYLSVDPLMAAASALGCQPGDVMLGLQVARVTNSRNDRYPVGMLVLVKSGWRTLTLVAPSDGTPLPQPLPPLGGLPPSYALGVLGPPGLTAYFGLLKICRPKEGDTLHVNGAAGATGSIVVQIAKLKGCRVIASAGSVEKCNWLRSLGADHVFNYKVTDVDKALHEAAPDGIDCYFDNVGGEYTDKAIRHMRKGGRVCICGAISLYDNLSSQSTGPRPFLLMVSLQFSMEGFQVNRWEERYPEAQAQLLQWLLQGKIECRETVTSGFSQLPKALAGLFKGENIGKALVTP